MNKHHRKPKSMGGAPMPKAGANKSSIPERTAAWPSVPGRTQSKDRSNGVRKIKGHAKSVGI